MFDSYTTLLQRFVFTSRSPSAAAAAELLARTPAAVVPSSSSSSPSFAVSAILLNSAVHRSLPSFPLSLPLLAVSASHICSPSFATRHCLFFVVLYPFHHSALILCSFRSRILSLHLSTLARQAVLYFPLLYSLFFFRCPADWLEQRFDSQIHQLLHFHFPRIPLSSARRKQDAE